MEIVSPDPSLSISKHSQSTSPTVIDEHICLHHITLRRRYKNTTSPIIGHDRRSTWILSEYLTFQRGSLHLYRFQNAIKKVRAVQRMRRNRGFAFSQTENPARQDQSRLIRAYDTSQTHTRPSGYWRIASSVFFYIVWYPRTVLDLYFTALYYLMHARDW